MTDNDKNIPGGEIEKNLEEPNRRDRDIIPGGEPVGGPLPFEEGAGAIEGRQELAGAGEREAGGPGGDPGRPEYNLLDLIYGVLFDPVRTFKKAAADPPLWQSVLIYAIVTVFSGAMGTFINFRTMPLAVSDLPMGVLRIVQGMLPLIALGGVVLQFIKWFTYSALLHLLADFYGGKGTARGVFTVYGLAGLPTLFIIPVQLLALAVLPGNFFLNILVIPISLALAVWGIILLVLGIREVHRFSTGRALAVVFTPVLVIALLIIIAVVILISVAASIPSQIPRHFL